MKKKKITYGVSGMMEYQAIVKIGKATMKVPFSDGSMTAMGVNPATFTTENFMTQRAIENSSDFKRGRIFIHKVIELNENVEIARNPVKKGAAPEDLHKESEAIPTKAKAVADTLEDIRKDIFDKASVPASAFAPEAETHVNAEESNQPEEVAESTSQQEETASPEQVEFANNDDAKDYLEAKFGVKRSKLHNRAEIIETGKANGVDIIFVAN